MIPATLGRVSDCTQGGEVHGGTAESEMSLGMEIAWSMRGCCTGRASDLDVMVQLARGRASFGRVRASSAPVAGALS
jgi:hypothetical protein